MGWSNVEMAKRFGWPEERVVQCLDQVLARLKLSSRIELAFLLPRNRARLSLHDMESRIQPAPPGSSLPSPPAGWGETFSFASTGSMHSTASCSDDPNLVASS